MDVFNKKKLFLLFPFIPVIVFIIFISGCSKKPEVLTTLSAKRLIAKNIGYATFFSVPYSKAVSVSNDKFYLVLLKKRYIKFNKKLGYTSFTRHFKPYLFKKANKTYIILGIFKSIKVEHIKFISKIRAFGRFSFNFKPNPVYKLMAKNEIYFRQFKILKQGKALAIFKKKPFLQWGLSGFKSSILSVKKYAGKIKNK